MVLLGLLRPAAASGQDVQVRPPATLFCPGLKTAHGSNFPNPPKKCASDAQISSLDGTNGLVIHGRNQYDHSGRSVSSGDVNGDGYADLLIGAAHADGSSNSASFTGETYVVFGKASGWAASMSVGSRFFFVV